MLIVTLSISLVAILMNFYLFLMIVSTNLSMKNIFRNSFYLGIVCMKQNLFSLGILAVVVGGILLLALKTNMMVLMIIFDAAAVYSGDMVGVDGHRQQLSIYSKVYHQPVL